MGRIASNDELAAKAHARKEHLHLLGRCVLSLVKNDEGIVERAAAHIGERSNLNNPLLNEGVSLLHVRHVEERVVERANVGVELLLEGSRKVTEGFSSLDDGTAEHDTANLTTLERCHGHGHSEVGLARASGTKSERKRVPTDGLDITTLSCGLRPESTAAIG